MKRVDRRSALKIGFAAASGAVIRPAAAQTTDALAGKDTSPWPGVVVRTYGESPSLIPGFKTVSLLVEPEPGAAMIEFYRMRAREAAEKKAAAEATQRHPAT